MTAAFVEQLKAKGVGRGKRKGSAAPKVKAKAAAVSQPVEAEAGPALRVVTPAACAETLVDEEGFVKYGFLRKERQRLMLTTQQHNQTMTMDFHLTLTRICQNLINPSSPPLHAFF